VDTFSVAADDPDGNVLSYAWTFGDGTSDSNASPSHTYLTAGTFQALVTIQDGYGGSVVSNVTVVVSPNSTGGSAPGDTPTPVAFLMQKLSAKMDFAKTNRDAISFSGTLPNLAVGFNAAGKHVTLVAGTATLELNLGANGQGKSAHGSFVLKRKPVRGSNKKTFPGGNTAFQATFKNGTWSQNWLGTVADPSSISGKTISIPVEIILDGVTYEVQATLKFRYLKSKKGKLSL
jgi:PKD repeat protein